MRATLRKISYITGIMALAVVSAVVPTLRVFAVATNPQPAAQISFTFDDGLTSTLNQAAPTLKKYGLNGTAYIPTDCIGSVNTCNANTIAKYMTWAQVAKLKNTYGWEIAAHTMSHYPMTTLSDAEKDRQLSMSKQILAAQGHDAVSYASPEGDYDMATLSLVAKYYASHRGFWDQGVNPWPNSEYLVRVMQVQAGVTLTQVKAAIDSAIANKQWIVLVFHDIKPNASNNPDDYQYRTSSLEAIAAYVKLKQTAGLIKPTLVKDAFVTGTPNLLTNSSFNNGIADGWTTDTPQNVTLDTANNGSYPDARNAIKFTAGTTNTHLFSPRVAVDANTTYLLKNFINVTQNSGGELGFYIDEYDANGNWVSGQWKGAERSVFVENFNFSYTPSSGAVASASLQIYASANSGVAAYLDNVQWFTLRTTTPPTRTNLVANGTFDRGIADGWSTDTGASVTADATGNGSPSDPQHSVKFIASTTNTHLFSPRVSVSNATTYSLAAYLKIAQRSGGEAGFYIDEYDANGNWVSGQWKGARTAVSAADSSFTYKPTSSAVATASLQVYVTGGSGITAYVDAVRWYAQ